MLKMSRFKCQKCRKELFDAAFVLTSHSEPWTVSKASPCSAGHTVWYLKDEVVETWLQTQLDSNEWIKGKINCPKCNLRLGSFDFVSGKRCGCGKHMLPPIHIVKSRVDHENSEILRQALNQFVQIPLNDFNGNGKNEAIDPKTLTTISKLEVPTAATAVCALNEIYTE